jgi:hypothetical protein
MPSCNACRICSLEHVNKRKRITYETRHCEERSDVAIHAAVQLPETPKQTEKAVWIATSLRSSQ